MSQFCSWNAAQKSNQWASLNILRWKNDEYDRTYTASQAELDPVKRAALFIRMNDLLIQNVVMIPLVWRNVVAGASNRLKGTDISGWDSNLWHLPYWHREG